MPARPRSKSAKGASTSPVGRRGGGQAAGGGGRPKRDEWFNPDRDEDIDDDLAFDSDDEKMYGGFFKQQKQSAPGKGGKKGKAQAAADGGEEAGFDDWGDEDGGSDAGFSDDSRDEIDISELLESKEERAQAAAVRRKARGGDEETSPQDTAAPAKGASKAAAAAPRGRAMREAESMLLAPSARRSKTSLAEVTKAAMGAVDDDATRQRLEGLRDTHGLIGTEMGEHDKLQMDRGLVRDSVKKDMEKWKPFVKEQRTARSMSFPLKAPNQNPVPSTVAGLVSVQQERIAKAAAQLRGSDAPATAADDDDDDDEPAKAKPQVSDAAAAVVSMATSMDDLLARSGLGTTKAQKQLAREAKATSTRPSDASLEGFAGDDGYLEVTGEERVGGGEGLEAEATGDGDGENPDMGYVAKLKALVGYDVAKRKRFNKIKSKTYRRILRKEKERERELKQRALELVNPDAARKKAQERLDRMRAEERATQRHKNTSKWVRHVKHMAKFDEGAKDAIKEQDVLRQRLMVKADEAADEELALPSDDDLSSSEEGDRRVDELLAGRAHATSALWGGGGEQDAGSDQEGLDDADGDEKQAKLRKARKELESMDFMKKAKARHREQLRADAAELQEDIERHRQGLDPLHGDDAAAFGSDADDDDADAREERRRVAMEDRAGALDVHGLRERQDKAVAAVAQRDKREKAEEARRVAELKSTAAGSGRKQFGLAAAAADDERMPGSRRRVAVDVELASPQGMVAGEGEARTLGAKRAEAEATPSKSRKSRLSAASSAALAVEDALVDDGAEEDENVSSSKRKKGKSRREAAAATAADAKQPQEAPDADEPDEPRASAGPKKRTRAEGTKVSAGKADGAGDGTGMSHDYLVSRAFARDDVDEDFAAAKAAQVEAALKPEDANASLPGWGEWGGESERLNRRHKERVQDMELKRNIERTAMASARADAKLDHAIINHDVGMVPDKHTLHMVPRPYDSAVQYERAVRQPLGPEYNSVRTFQEGVAPRVQSKKGVAIDPVDLTTGMHKKAITKRRKGADVDQSLAEVALMPDAKERRKAAKAAGAEQRAAKAAARTASTKAGKKGDNGRLKQRSA